MPLFAPGIDQLTESGSLNANAPGQEIRNRLVGLYTAMGKIGVQGDDDFRAIWLEIPRGGIRNFGKFVDYKKSGEVETREEFKQLWESNYPEKTKWYKLSTATYKDELFFYINSNLLCSFSTKDPMDKDESDWTMEVCDILDGLLERVNNETERLERDPGDWNAYLKKNLPYHLRLGKIKRFDYWNILGTDAMRFDKMVGKTGIRKLKRYMDESDLPGYNMILPGMTANDFFRYCEIGYEANGYFTGERRNLSAREKYTAMADGRDSGLREIPGDCEQAFRDWYHGSGWSIGHPWEICRGGNSTHISLYVTPKDNGWKLTLAGSSAARVVETVKIAISLHEHAIPFEVRDKRDIMNMILGTDMIGIVPEFITPRYCHSLFLKEDHIRDFMNLDLELKEQIIQAAAWYPQEEVQPA